MKAIPNHPGYFASEDGAIYSTRISYTPRPLSLRKRVNGYPVVSIFTHWKSKPKHRFVHQLILETFVGPRPDGFEAAHRNGIRHDCRADNLCWTTPQKNREQVEEHGHLLHGDAATCRKLTSANVIEIVGLFQRGMGRQSLADHYNVSYDTIADIITGRSWRRITRIHRPPTKEKSK